MLRSLLNMLWLSVAALVILIAVVVSLGRVLLPELPKYRGELERMASTALGVPVRLGELKSRWALGGPVLEMHDIVLPDRDGLPQLTISRIDLALDIWRSAVNRRPVARRFEASGADLTLDRLPDGSWHLRGLPETDNPAAQTPIKAAADFLLAQRFLSLRDSRIELHQPGKPVVPIALGELSLRNGFRQHQAVGDARLVGGSGGGFRFVVETDGDPREPATPTRLYVAASGHWLPALPLPKLEGYTLERAGLNGELWAERRHKRWSHGQVRFQIDDLRLAHEQQPLALPNRFHGRLRWEADAKGWHLYASELALAGGDDAWQPFDLRLEQVEGQWGLALSRVELARVAAAAQQLPLLDETVRQRLAGLKPQGELQDLGVQWSRTPAGQFRWQGASGLRQAGWSAHDGIPGVQGLDASVAAAPEGGIALVRAAQGADFKGLFRTPFVLTALQAGVAWRVEQDGAWQLDVPGARVATEDATVKARMVLAHPVSGPAEISLYGELSEARTNHVDRYLPAGIMSEGLVHYLDTAVKPGGRLPLARIALRGPLDRFPFENPEGVFSIAARAEELPFRFLEDWPQIDGLGADLFFEGDSMRIVADRGSLAGVGIRQAQAVIPALSAAMPQLSIVAQAEGRGEQITQVVRASPLPRILGGDIDVLGLTGNGSIDLKLGIPLAQPEHLSIDGKLKLADADLSAAPLGTLLTDLNGELAFSESALSAKAVRGKLFGEPVSVDLGQRKSGARTTIEATARGTITAKALQKLQLPLSERLAGKTRYTAVFAITPKGKSESVRSLSVASDLKGLAIDLPAPLTLNGEGRMLSADVELGKDTVLTAHLGEVLQAKARWQTSDTGETRFDRATLNGGPDTPELPGQPGLAVGGHLRELAAKPWVDTVQGLLAQPAAGAAPDFLGVDMAVDALDLYGVTVHKAKVEVQDSRDGLAVGLDSTEIAGKLLLPKDASRQALMLDLERAYLPKLASGDSEATDAAASEDDLPVDPATLPRLSVTCRDCRYGDEYQGQLRLTTLPGSDGLEIREFSLKNRSTELSVTGRWVGGTHERTELRGHLTSPNIGQFAEDWRLAFSARDSKLNADFELAWNGDPVQFNWTSANGFLNGKMTQGHLEDISDKGARVFSLLSLQSLRRRLTLDFSDVFSKGFFYNSISGGFRIENGVASTDNTHIDGLAADVDITGHTDLVHRTFDQRVRVVPELSSSLPVLAGWAVEPTMALVVLALNTVLQPAIDVITRIDYKVTGPWDAPVLEEVGKSKGSVKVDAKTDAKAGASDASGGNPPAPEQSKPETPRPPTQEKP